jgi:ribosomal-protein-alanine N-acetyltransferase
MTLVKGAAIDDGAEARPRDEAFDVAQPSDVEALVAIDASSARPWAAQTFLDEVRRTPPTLFVLRSSGTVVAFAASRIQIPEMDIVNLAVAKGHRRLGFGLRLLKALLRHAADRGVCEVFLEVSEGNAGARGLYATSGFQETQRRRGFYQNPVEDAILMRLKI